MDKPYKVIPFLALALIVGYLACGPAVAEDADVEARKAKILSNLKLRIPQLEQADVTMGELKPSGFEGLDQGSFTIAGQRPRVQQFLVSSDDTKLYMISEPFDVSRSEEDVKVELTERQAAKEKEAVERRQELAAATANLPARGNAEAPVTIVEFSDFQCPYCSRGAKTVEQILAKYPSDVKLVFKHFPLNFHPWAKPAAVATVCAAEQSPDAFWTLHDQFFAHQKELNPQNVVAKSKEYLKDSGIDMAKWSTCAEDKESEANKAAVASVDADMAFGQKLGVRGTPGFFVNGRFLSGAQPITAFEPLIVEAKNDTP
ncbi:MAG: DsbA family protein [bacterium]|nr:DsbA family protein [bacterium]